MYQPFHAGALRAAVAACCAAIPLFAVAHGQAHSHGDARLDVAVEGQRISLSLSSPLDNLLGFERAPRTDAERQKVQAMTDRLKAGEAVFVIDPAGGCRLQDVSLTSSVLGLGPAAGGGAPGDAHADLDGDYAFTCTDAAKARYIDVRLFEGGRLRRLDVQLIMPSGQAKRTLTPKAPRLNLGR